MQHAEPLQQLHARVAEAIDREAMPLTPLGRFNLFKANLLRSVESTPAAKSLASIIFAEADKLVRHFETLPASVDTEVSRTAMQSAIRESAAAATRELDLKQRVHDLEACVSGLVQTNVDAAKLHEEFEAFVRQIREAIAMVDGLRGSNPTPLLPETRDASEYVGAVVSIGDELCWMREENLRLADLAAKAVDAHSTQSLEMADLLDRANGFQTHVEHMKVTMRVMKTYIDKLERRVLQLTDLVTRDSKLSLRAVALDIESQTNGLNASSLYNAGFATLSARGATGFDATHDGILASAPAALPSVDAVVAELALKFSDTPAHLRQLSLPKLNPRPIDTWDALSALLDEASAFACAAPQSKPFDEHVWGYVVQRAPAGSVKWATELAMSMQFLTARAECRSAKAYLFQLLVQGRIGSDFGARSAAYLHEFAERCRQLEPTTKRFKDRVPRDHFLRAARECWPSMTLHEAQALGMATVTASSVDGVKVAEDVAYEPYFAPTTAGHRLVHDQLLIAMAHSGMRFLDAIFKHCAGAAAADVEQRNAKTQRERAVAQSAEVRRMMRLDDNELAKYADAVSIADVDASIAAVDPKMPPQRRLTLLAACAASMGVATTADDVWQHHADLEIQLGNARRYVQSRLFVLPTTPWSIAEVPVDQPNEPSKE